MEQICILLDNNDFDIDDYDKVKKICEKKIEELLYIDNVLYIKEMQELNFNKHIMVEFRNFLMEHDVVKIKKSLEWNSFTEFDFCKMVNNEYITKKELNKFCGALKKMDFRSTCISYMKMESIQKVANIIEDNANVCIEIDLSDNLICDEGIDVLIQVFQKNDKLQIINLSNNRISNAGEKKLQALKDTMKSLKKLIL